MSPWAEDIGLPGLIEYGGELIYAVDFTPGGAPIGLAVRDLEAYLSGDFAMEEDDELGDIDEHVSVDEVDQPYRPGTISSTRQANNSFSFSMDLSSDA